MYAEQQASKNINKYDGMDEVLKKVLKRFISLPEEEVKRNNEILQQEAMVITCWAPDCKHNNARNLCKFFRFPRDKKKMTTWLTLLRRDGEPGSGARVCSCHFREQNKENLPEIFERNKEVLFKDHHLSPEKKRKRTHPPMSEIQSAPSTSATPDVADEGIQEEMPIDVPIAGSSQDYLKLSTSMVEAENYLLKIEIERREKIEESLRMQMSYLHICESDKLILEYSGLPTRNIFESLFALIENVEINYYLKWKVEKLSKIDQLLVVLMKLRHNFSHTDLAFRFKVSKATITNIVITFLHLLHGALFKTLLKDIPKRSKNRSCLPNCASSFTNCRIIIDCTDIFCAVPRKSMKRQRLTYSSYKHRNSFKGLVGVAPNGVVTFLSSLYPGSTSDKDIVKHCRILDQMEPGDLILADKSFLILDLLPSGVTLNIPPFLSTPQFTTEQIQHTKCIARARIHVERAIRRMKSYKILSVIPEPLFHYSSVIFQTVGALTNLQYPLIKEVSQFYVDREVLEDAQPTSD